jgi:hypothetical protein
MATERYPLCGEFHTRDGRGDEIDVDYTFEIPLKVAQSANPLSPATRS